MPVIKINLFSFRILSLKYWLFLIKLKKLKKIYVGIYKIAKMILFKKKIIEGETQRDILYVSLFGI